MKYTQAGNCPFCDAERGMATVCSTSPDGWGNFQDRHALGHPENSPEAPRELSRDSEITVTRLNTAYELTNGKETIEAEVKNGKLTLSNREGDNEFVFIGSDPACIRKMCELFIRTCELVEEAK